MQRGKEIDFTNTIQEVRASCYKFSQQMKPGPWSNQKVMEWCQTTSQKQKKLWVSSARKSMASGVWDGKRIILLTFYLKGQQLTLPALLKH
jgi:hypothetical protein